MSIKLSYLIKYLFYFLFCIYIITSIYPNPENKDSSNPKIPGPTFPNKYITKNMQKTILKVKQKKVSPVSQGNKHEAIQKVIPNKIKPVSLSSPPFHKNGLPQLLQKDLRYISLLFGGDIHFSWGIAKLQKEKGVLAPIIEIQELFKYFDFRALNLETSISSQGMPLNNKNYIFASAAPPAIELLKSLQVNLVILGNNHAMDMREQGLLNTIDYLKVANIAYTGAGENTSKALQAYRFQENKHSFSILSGSHVGIPSIFTTTKKPGILQHIPLNTILQNARSSQVIVSMHWGREYFLHPKPQQTHLAHKLIKKGRVSAIIGHHPHIPQAVEVYKNSVIFYSLGNFLFGSTNVLQRNNILAALDYSRKTGRLARVRIIPITGRYQSQTHVVRLLRSHLELRDFWKNFYAITYQQSPRTARLLQVKEGIGVIELIPL